MLIGLGSQSEVKQAAVTHALHQMGIDAQVIAVKADSGVNEQPFDQETVIGAYHRLMHTVEMVPNADLTIAIESGIFQRDGRYLDIAIVVLRLPDGERFVQESEGVIFPSDAVDCGQSLTREWARSVAQ